jgi:hypothetical protein
VCFAVTRARSSRSREKAWGRGHSFQTLTRAHAAPSYFSQYFQCQVKQAEANGEDVSAAIRTLYIDRDPVTFKDISLHLQGYHVQPRDGTHFVRLFADAQFYSCWSTRAVPN